MEKTTKILTLLSVAIFLLCFCASVWIGVSLNDTEAYIMAGIFLLALIWAIFMSYKIFKK